MTIGLLLLSYMTWTVPVCNVRLLSARCCSKIDIDKFLELRSGFETILESASGVTLALDMKQSEIALKDLNTLVKHSNLACKDSLAENLQAFVAEAKVVGIRLDRLGSRVGGAVDK